MNLNEPIMFKETSTSILFVFILQVFLLYLMFCLLLHTAPISQLNSNHLCCNEQPEATEMFCFVFLQSLLKSSLSANGEKFSKPFSALTSTTVKAWMSTLTKIMWKMQSQKSIYHHGMEWISSSCSECWQHLNASFIYFFSVESSSASKVTGCWKKPWHMVLFAEAEVVLNAELSLRASTRALSSFFFEFTSYLSFISHMHLHRTYRLGKWF